MIKVNNKRIENENSKLDLDEFYMIPLEYTTPKKYYGSYARTFTEYEKAYITPITSEIEISQHIAHEHIEHELIDNPGACLEIITTLKTMKINSYIKTYHPYVYYELLSYNIPYYEVTPLVEDIIYNSLIYYGHKN